MRYFIGAWVLCCIGYVGGDILTSSLGVGVAFGFIDFMKERSM
jgi:hypothetical protein